MRQAAFVEAVRIYYDLFNGRADADDVDTPAARGLIAVMTDTHFPGSFADCIAAAQAHVSAEHWGEAIIALDRATALRPEADGAWRALGDTKRAAGDEAGASAAHDRAARLSLERPPLAGAVSVIAEHRLAAAEQIVRARLATAPTDVAAIILLADLARRASNVVDAGRFLRRALEIAPDYLPARENLARLLYEDRDLPAALAAFDALLAVNPDHPGYRNLHAAILDMTGDHQGAIAAYHAMLADDPAQPLVWMTLGNALKTVGDIPAAIAAFRHSLALAPDTGDSWWGLANLKSFAFKAEDIAAMEAEIARPALADANRIGLGFALGKAFEDAGRYAESFKHYDAANRLQLAHAPHDPDALSAYTRRCDALFTPTFFAARVGGGDPTPDPIFIVGMPRSGSTLVEQILASHPAIEGTMELPLLPRMARALGGGAYPDTLAQLPPAQFAALGADYLRHAAMWRRTDRPFFIDKLPANFMSVGLIRLILPNAKIIDVRRHPLGCGLSVFKQHFPKGAGFGTALDHVGRFYADYVRMMQLWDARLPGCVHRVFYEELVANTEGVVRQLLDFLGLPFDPACLAFHANQRAVGTPSAEQVRRPIDAAPIDHWRHYEAWLDPLKQALGDALIDYPATRIVYVP